MNAAASALLAQPKSLFSNLLFPSLVGKLCPQCGRVVETLQSIVPPGPENARCESCNLIWIDGVCVRVGKWTRPAAVTSTISWSESGQRGGGAGACAIPVRTKDQEGPNVHHLG